MLQCLAMLSFPMPTASLSHTTDDSPRTSWRKLYLTQPPPRLPWAPWTPGRRLSSGSTDCAHRTRAAEGGGAFCVYKHKIPQMQRLRLQWRVTVSHTVPLSLLLAPHSTLCQPSSLFSRKVFSRIPHFLILNVTKYPNAYFFHAWFHNIVPVTIPI